MAEVLLTEEAREDLLDLDGAARKIVGKGLKKLEENPEQRGAPLGSRHEGNLTTFRKLVVGDREYRIVFRVNEDGSVCVVSVIAKRSDDHCYELAVARLRMHGGEAAQEMENVLHDTWSVTRKS